MKEAKRIEPQLEDVEDLAHRIQSLLHVKEANNPTTVNHLLNDSGYTKMEEVKRSGPELEYVTDLVHRIQSLLPVKEAARTCVLSKSWLHAWSTLPILGFSFTPSRFDKSLVLKEKATIYMNSFYRTVQRYNQDKIPFKTFNLELTIKNQVSASLAIKWIQIVATNPCLKEFNLYICNGSGSNFILPDEIFSGESLYSIVIRAPDTYYTVAVSENPVFNCVSLRVLELVNVDISDDELDSLISTCTLLEKIKLSYLSYWIEIKVENLCHLQTLMLDLRSMNDHSCFHDYASINSVINCVALKVIDFMCVNMCDEVLDSLFATCPLLEKFELSHCRDLTKINVKNLRYLRELELSVCRDLKIIKVKNLRYLQEFRFVPWGEYEILEVNDVPNLQIFWYKSSYSAHKPLNIESLSRVTELVLEAEIIDVGFFDMINSKLPYLEILDLTFESSSMEKLDIKSVSLKKLRLEFYKDYMHTANNNRQIDVQVYAPKLRHLFYHGPTIPNLMFPNHAHPEEIQLILKLCKHMDNSFFYKMREVLSLSSKFDIDVYIGYHDEDVSVPPVYMDIDDLKRRFPFPFTNVHQLSFNFNPKVVSVHISCFDALYTICHPNYIETVGIREDRCSSLFELIIRGLENQKTSDHLKSIEFKNPCNEKWEILLTDSCTGIFDKPDNGLYSFMLKLNWCS